jgi:clan AA aspartic protease
MIAGAVGDDLDATIRLELTGRKGREMVDAVVDTGFSGFLTLPSNIVEALGLSWLGREEGLLADGAVCIFDVYIATVLWNGNDRGIEVEVASNQPLIGMGMLHGHSLRIDVVNGGLVSIESLP